MSGETIQRAHEIASTRVRSSSAGLFLNASGPSGDAGATTRGGAYGRIIQLSGWQSTRQVQATANSTQCVKNKTLNFDYVWKHGIQH